MSLPRIFKLFRAMGLRHIVVVNDSNEVIISSLPINYCFSIFVIKNWIVYSHSNYRLLGLSHAKI